MGNMRMKKTHIYTAILLGLCGTVSTANAADTLKAYTSSLLQLDDRNARSKKIRLIYTVQNVWNQSHVPTGVKEVKLILKGGSGFDMTNVPTISTLYEYSNGADYRYSVPTAFKLKVGYVGGSRLRHINHVPANTIGSANVSEAIAFNLGFSAAEAPAISGGVDWSHRVTYKQAEFETTADFSQRNDTVTWDIENKTIRHNKSPKHWLISSYLSCYKSNLIKKNRLPVVMRSDFRPEAAVVYRKNVLNDGQTSTRLKLYAGWEKTDYHFGRDLCNWYTNWTWKNHRDSSRWTQTERQVNVSWSDRLYR
jgi:leukocidin/hemolysin toxin family protein